jgi:nitroreductase
MNETIRAIQGRHSVRKFSQKPVEERLLVEVLEAANRAPSSYNLQPWSFIIVRDPDLRKIMREISLNQAQVEEAPVVIVLLADTNFWRSGYPELLDLSLAEGSIPPENATRYRKNTRIMFDLGPFGGFGIFKAIGLQIRRYFHPTPYIPCSKAELRSYVVTQTMLAGATLMIAAKSLGLDTCPMEGFDEPRLKKLLGVPAHIVIPMIIPIGYSIEGNTPQRSLRLPLNQRLFLDVYTNPVKKIKA